MYLFVHPFDGRENTIRYQCVIVYRMPNKIYTYLFTSFNQLTQLNSVPVTVDMCASFRLDIGICVDLALLCSVRLCYALHSIICAACGDQNSKRDRAKDKEREMNLYLAHLRFLCFSLFKAIHKEFGDKEACLKNVIE